MQSLSVGKISAVCGGSAGRGQRRPDETETREPLTSVSDLRSTTGLTDAQHVPLPNLGALLDLNTKTRN